MTPAGDVPAVMQTLSAADLAWWNGDRRAAVSMWRDVLRTGEDDPVGRAAEAMVRIRLLRVDGNLGPFVHEARLRAALSACPSTEPWCTIAHADFDLFMPAFTGADPARVAEELSGCPLSGPVAARIALASRDPSPLAGREDLDGIGLGILATGALAPPDPGTWFLGVGVAGAPGAGAGFSVRFDHPDVAWRGHHLQVTGAVDTLGGWSLGAGLATAGRPSAELGVGAGAARGALWEENGASPYRLRTGRSSVGVASRRGPIGGRLGVGARVDDAGFPEGTAVEIPVDGWAGVAGPYVSVTLGTASAWMRGGVETGAGAYTHVGWTVDGRHQAPVLGGAVAMRALGTAVSSPASPFYRLPDAGGATLLRGEPAGRYRGRTLVAGQVELRHPIAGPIHAAVFVDTARVGDAPDPDDGGTWHWTAGGGVRLVLPPEQTNVTRLDVGIGRGTWGVVFALGEAF